MTSLRGEIAIVAGAGRGFGRSIALALAEHGASVCVASRSREELRQTTDTIRERGGTAREAVGDLTRPTDIETVVAACHELGPPTILVFAAGVPGPFGPLWAADPDAWWASMTLHIRAPALLLRHVLPSMIDRNRGRVILVSSRAGDGVHAFLAPYCVGKAAQTRLAAVADSETREHGVRVFAIDPGLAFTQLATATVADPAARRFLPGMVQRLSALGGADSNDAVIRRCALRCVDLVSGRYDALGGRFVTSDANLDELLRDIRRLESAES